MITSRLTAVALTTSLTSVAFAATSASGTDPIKRPESAATQDIDKFADASDAQYLSILTKRSP